MNTYNLWWLYIFAVLPCITECMQENVCKWNEMKLNSTVFTEDLYHHYNTSSCLCSTETVFHTLTHKNAKKMQWAAEYNHQDKKFLRAYTLNQTSIMSIRVFLNLIGLVHALLSADWLPVRLVSPPSFRHLSVLDPILTVRPPPASFWLVNATATH